MWGILTNMVTTRRSSARLQEKQVAASAPVSPTPSATNSSPSTRRARSATKASPPSATRTRRTTPTKTGTGSGAKRGRPRKTPVESEPDDSAATQSDTASDQQTENGAEETNVNKQIFVEDAEMTQPVDLSGELEQTATAPEVEPEEQKSEKDTAMVEDAKDEDETEPEVVATTESTTEDEAEVEPERPSIDDFEQNKPVEDEEDGEDEIVMMDSSDEEEKENAEEVDPAALVNSTSGVDEDEGDDEDDDDDFDVAQFAQMAAAGISLSTSSSSTNSAATTSSSSGFQLVPDTLDSGASTRTKFLEFEGTKLGLGAKVVASTASIEEQKVLAHQLGKVAKSNRQRSEAQNVSSAGRKWFDMATHEMDADARRDFALLKMRNYLDPKKFYKTSDHTKKMPKHFQFGTVIEGAHEFKSARLSKKERKQTFTDEIMADEGVRSYTKRVFLQVQNKRAGGQGKKKKQKRF